MFQHSPLPVWRAGGKGQPSQQISVALRSSSSPSLPFVIDTASAGQASWALVSLQSSDWSLIILGGVAPTEAPPALYEPLGIFQHERY